MTAKNVVAKDWSSWGINFDNTRDSRYPAGNKPTGYQTTPTLLDTDIVSGSMTGGEGNKGAYLRLYGYALGRQSNLGATSGACVFMRDPLGDNAWHEVDNYRALVLSKVYPTHQVQELICQIGALGGAQTNGRALDVKITVNGVDTNVLVGQFTLQPGNFYFVDNVNGSESTGAVNDIAHPFRYWQFAVGGLNNFTGIWAPGNLQAGDTIVGRAHAGSPWVDNTGFDTRCIRFRSHTGTLPNGTAGNGYIHFTAYPGPILGNAPEAVTFNDPPGGGGFIQGVNTAYGLPNAPAYGQYVSVSGIVMTMDAASRGDSGGVNLQTSATAWRVYGCEIGPWPSNLVTPDNAKSGCVAGNGVGVKVKFNYLHDVYCDINNPSTSANENHILYFDGSNLCARNCEIAYNWCKNALGGSLCQFYNADASDTQTGNKVHHNVFDTSRKYGGNNADDTTSCDWWNNIFLHTASTGMRFGSENINQVIRVTHNLFVDCVTSGAGPAQGTINTDATVGAGSSIQVNHNIIVLSSGRAAASPARTSNDFYTANATDTGVTFSQNLYYDPDALKTPPAADAAAITGNPLFVNAAAGNYSLGAGSPGLAACTTAEIFAILDDLYGVGRPVPGTGAPGGTKNDIGPTQGVGT